MSAAIVEKVRREYAAEMLKHARLMTMVSKSLVLNEIRLDEKAVKIAGPTHKEHHFVELMDWHDLEDIVQMGSTIMQDAEVLMNGTSEIYTLTKTVKKKPNKQETTTYSDSELMEQALLLRGVRHMHARKAAVLVRKLGVLVRGMKKLDGRIKKAVAKALRSSRKPNMSPEETGFVIVGLGFDWVTEKVDEVLEDIQPVADASVAPPMPCEIWPDM